MYDTERSCDLSRYCNCIVLCGPLVICRTTPDGEFTDAEEDDLYTVGEYLVLVEHKKEMRS